jgi:hypothetical protein
MKQQTCLRERPNRKSLATYHATLHQRTRDECRLDNWLETITFPDPVTGEALWFRFAQRVRLTPSDRLKRIYLSDFGNQRIVMVRAGGRTQEIPLLPMSPPDAI